MQLTQRCQYALRALFQLARQAEQNPADPVLAAGSIAKAQAIPKRFLDGILLELRQAGFVDSRRGKAGGFFLARPSGEITIGQVIRLYTGAMGPVDCRADTPEPCPLLGGCVFMSVWEEARTALEGVYDAISLAELLRREQGASPSPLFSPAPA